MESRAVLLESRASPLNLLLQLHELRRLGRLCDVTVRVEGPGARGDFAAHKAVLAAASAFFKDAFLSAEGAEGAGGRTTVLLKEVRAADFAAFLEFVYTARVRVEADAVQRLLDTAERLRCPDLSETCLQLKKRTLESVLLGLQSCPAPQEPGVGGASADPPSAGPAGPGEPPGGGGDVQPPGQPPGEDLAPARRAREKADRRRDVAKLPYPKIRRASGRLAGRKVFVEIPKKKYTRGLREQAGQEPEPQPEPAGADPEPQPEPAGADPEPLPEPAGADPEPGAQAEEQSQGEGGGGGGAGQEEAQELEAQPQPDEAPGEAQEEAGEAQAEAETGAQRRRGFQCALCHRAFQYEKSFRKHELQRHGRAAAPEPRCEACGQTFANRCNLRSHQRHVHSSERRFPCALCGKRFKRAKDVRRHGLQVHEGGGRRHRCGQCGKGLSSGTALRLHERTHTGARPHACPDCGARFAQPSALKTHARIHTGEKPFVCDECGARFTQNHMLIYHKRCHTGERPFMCETCGKSFASKEYLKHHNRIHTGSKPFKCEICLRTFAQRNSLYQHIKVHTGERPYCCGQCGKQFTQLNALQRHRRIHTGEKPFMCNACGRTFTDKSTLRRHTAIHDKNTPWKSFLVIVDGSPKNDEGHKMEQPGEDCASPRLPDKLLSFPENGQFHSLAVVHGGMATVPESSAADTAPLPQDALLASTLSGLGELAPQDPGPQLHPLTSVE